MPALLEQFTVIDPVERLNLPLKLSTRTALAQYQVFLVEEYKVPADRNTMIERMLLKFVTMDPGFEKFVKKMTPEQKLAAEEVLKSQKSARSNGGIGDTLIDEV